MAGWPLTVSVAVIIAIGVNTDGRREVPGLEIGPSEAEPIWTEVLRRPTRRGPRGVKPVISFVGQTVPRTVCRPSSPHDGIEAAVSKVPSATWQRGLGPCSEECRGPSRQERPRSPRSRGPSARHWLAVSAFIATAFAQETAEAASARWRTLADQIRPTAPRLAAIMDEAEHDLLASISFPKEHRTRPPGTNPIERPNGEIKRRTDVVGVRAMALTPQRPRRHPARRRAPAGTRHDPPAAQRSRTMTLDRVAPPGLRRAVDPPDRWLARLTPPISPHAAAR